MLTEFRVELQLGRGNRKLKLDSFVVDEFGLISVKNQLNPAAVRRLQRAYKAGLLRRLASGVYFPSAQWNALRGSEKLRLLALATMPAGARGIITGAAAIALHNQWLIHAGKELRIIGGTRHFGGALGVRRHESLIDDCDITDLHGRQVSTLPKAVFDEACLANVTNDLSSSVVAIEGARRAGVSVEDFELVSERYPRTRGIKGFRAVLAQCHGRVETPGEAVCKALLISMGLRCGVTVSDELDVFAEPSGPLEFFEQVNIVRVLPDGNLLLIGRVDFFVPAIGLVIEFDGEVKYVPGQVNATSDDVSMTIAHEQRRHRLMLSMGLAVEHVTWRDVFNGMGRKILERAIQDGYATFASRRPTFHGLAKLHFSGNSW